MLFAKASKGIPTPRLVHLFGEKIHWSYTARCLGVTLDTRLTWSSPIDQVRSKATQKLGVLGPLLNRRSDLSEIEFCCTSSCSVLWWTTDAPSWGLPLTHFSGYCRWFHSSVYAFLPVHLDTTVAGKFKRICNFHSLPTTSDVWEIRLKVSWCGEPLS